jgi:lysophospholipase L1-like esterase
MLGSNDMKEVFHATAEDIANGIGKMVKVILDFTKEKQAFIPRILLVSPAEIGEGLKTSPFYGSFSMNSIAVSRELPKWYKKVADEFGCEFLNAAEYAKASEEDSLHFTKEAHLALAEAFAKAIRKE